MKHFDDRDREVGDRVVEILESYLAGDDSSTFVKAFQKRIRIYAALLAKWGEKINLTARPDDPVEIAFHVIDSLAPIIASDPKGTLPIRKRITNRSRILDVGSGAGFPGLILVAATDAEAILLEARRKRASFLAVAASAMDLNHVEVAASLDSIDRSAPIFDVITMRAVGDFESVFEFGSHILKPDGAAIFYLNAGQAIDPRVASDHRMTELARISYKVPRRESRVARILAIYGRASA